MGLINIKDYITGLQCTWVKRCHQHGADNWRNDLLRLCYGNPFIVNTSIVSKDRNPILFNIATSYERFYFDFHSIGNNYLKAYIFKNKSFVRGANDGGLLCEKFFGRNVAFATLSKIAKIRLEDLLIRDRVKSLDEVNEDLGLNLTLVTYMRLTEAITHYLSTKAKLPNTLPVGIVPFMTTFNKGSNKLRKVLAVKNISSLNIENMTSVVSFRNITNTEIIELKFLKANLGFWNFTGQQNSVREFIYKFYNNQLGLNTRVAHFVRGHNRGCTLCQLKNINPLPDETFKHLFFDCDTVASLHKRLIEKYFSSLRNMNEQQQRQFWFNGIFENKANLFVTFAIFAFQFLIWKLKLRKEILNFSTMEQNWLYTLDVTHRLSNKIREAVLLINFDIRRCWHG